MRDALAAGWSEVPIANVADVVRGVTYKKEDSSSSPFESSVALLRATNIDGRSLQFNQPVYVRRNDVADQQMLRAGDVVIASSSGSRDLVGKAGQFFGSATPTTFGAFCTTLRPAPEIDIHYFGYYFQTDQYRKIVSDLAAGSNINNLKGSALADHVFPVAPLSEQTRIVDKLEELLSDLDAGVTELKAAQKKLAQYRQSLLKAAVEGQLTEAWRAQHGEPEETGAQLLARILRERRARWEAKQLAKFESQGTAPPRGWQAGYDEPLSANDTKLPALPSGWTWATLGELTDTLTSGSRDWSPFYDRGTCTFVMAQNVRPWRPDFTFKQLVDPPQGHRDRTRSMIRKDDLLVTIVGANTGQACRVDKELNDHFVCQSVALIRLSDRALSEFVNGVLNSPEHGQRQFREMNYGAGRPHLSFDQLESVLVPLPPLVEQQELLRQLEIAQSLIDGIESQIATARRYCDAQRKNILQAAFSGQLVPQDPNDEPASVLLERIRAERMNQPAQSRKPRVSRKAS